ncbi:MAG: hypothetical protein ACPGYX_10240 [Oceanobacter sp.]
MTTATISERATELLAEYAPRLDEVRQALLAELDKVDLTAKGQGLADDFSQLEVVVDPFDQSETLQGSWMSPFGMKQGSIQLLANGQTFAEYDVLVQHPTKPKWFIEAVTGWGKPGSLKTELRLILVPGS